MRILVFLLASLCSAQTFSAVTACTGSLYNSPALPQGFQQFRYGAVACDLSLPNGTYPVTLASIENRRANGLDGPVGIGVRVFSFTLNGVSTGPLDPFAAVGAQMPFTKLVQVPVTNGHLVIISTVIAGNPILALIGMGPVVPPLPVAVSTLQVSEIPQVSCLIVQLVDSSQRCLPIGAHLNLDGAALNVSFVIAPTVADWRLCAGSSGKSSCDGINYVALKHADGTPAIPMLAVPSPVGLVLGSNWSPVQ